VTYPFVAQASDAPGVVLELGLFICMFCWCYIKALYTKEWNGAMNIATLVTVVSIMGG
jgi:hypothetical protein